MNLIDTFRYLVALEQHKHFSRAAQACHITQPALSNSIRALEDELGVKIVNRGRIYQGLTEEGRRVLTSAYQVLYETDSLKKDINSRKGKPTGKLILGCIPSALPVASKFATKIKESFPEILTIVRSMASQEIELSLENHTIDMAFGYVDRFELSANDTTVIPQYLESYFLIGSKLHLSNVSSLLEEISWLKASKLQLCLLTSEMHNRVLLNSFFKNIEVEIKPAMETNSIFSLLLSVTDSKFSTILPGPIANVAKSFNELHISKLVAPVSNTSIGLLISSSKSLTIPQQKALEISEDDSWKTLLEFITVP